MDVEFEQVADEAKSSGAEHRLGYFLWERPAAKCLWTLSAAFWSGGAAALFVPSIESIYESAFAGLLYSILFPPLVFLYLALGWARQEVGAGRIELGPVPPPAFRSMSGLSDPMMDAHDARSPLYSKRVREMHKRRH